MEEETRARADARGRRTLEREFRRSLKPRVPPVESIKAGGHALEVDRSRAAYRRLSSNPLTASSRAVGFHPFVNDDKPATFSWRRPPSAPLGDVTRGRAAAGGTRRASPGASARFGDVVPPLRARARARALRGRRAATDGRLRRGGGVDEGLRRGQVVRAAEARRQLRAVVPDAPVERALERPEPLEGRGPVWKSTSELGYPEKYCVDLREPPRHRADVATGDNVASMA